MTKDEIIEQLLKAKVILEINGEYFYPDKKSGRITGGQCKNLPERYLGIPTRQQYKFFLEDCQIPHQHKGNFVYLLREETKESLAVLKAILENPTIDYQILVQKIKNYYKSVTSPKPMKSFLSENTWEAVYNAPLETGTKPVNTVMR